MKVIVEVVSPSSSRKADKMAEYADAGIPFYWLVWLSGDDVLSIDIHVLDHTLGYYRLYRTMTPEQETSTIDVPSESTSAGPTSPTSSAPNRAFRSNCTRATSVSTWS